jgi:serine/threonine protein kinase
VDIYSIGATLYLMLAGVMPHGLTEKNIIKQMRKQLTQPLRPIDELVPSLPPSLAKLIMAALARDQSLRPAIGDLQAELQRHVAAQPPLPAPPAPTMRPEVLELGETLLGPPSSQALALTSSDDGRPVGR